jgi:hypothetical protein
VVSAAVVQKPAVHDASPPGGVAAPTQIEATPISLYHRGSVSVGMPPEAAFKAFADLRSGGFENEDLPPGFKDPYQARSWEDGQHGFGLILFNGLVVAAMHQEEKVTLDELFSIVKDYKSRLAAAELTPRLISGAKVNYWFWDYGDQRLMICGFRSSPSQVQLTECMGEDVVLDALGISYERATQDEATIDGAPGFMGNRPPGSAK